MLGSIIEFGGALVLLGHDLFLRPREAYRRVLLIAPVKGQVHTNLADVFRTIRAIQVGVVLVALGFFLDLATFEWSRLAYENSTVRAIVGLVGGIIVARFGTIAARALARRDFQRAKPFDPETDIRTT